MCAPPVLVNLFAAQDDVLFRSIQEAEESIAIALNAGERILGHGRNEAIMAYGSNLPGAPINSSSGLEFFPPHPEVGWP